MSGERKQVNPIFRCKDCGLIQSHTEVCDKGSCERCGSIEWKLAKQIPDEDVKRLERDGYVFDPEFFDETV